LPFTIAGFVITAESTFTADWRTSDPTLVEVRPLQPDAWPL
jgi:hypothetical protein